MVGTRTNSTDNFVRFGGRKNELYVFGGFFHDFQQGVKSLLGNHMSFV